MQSNIFSSSHIHIATKHVMTLHSIHYDSTRLIRIRITWSDSADACTCGEYPYSTLSCSSSSCVLQVLRWNQISLTTRLALNEFQASCYSHHRSQSALSETNWPLRALGCSPYLESLPGYTDGAPPWAPTNRGHGITSRPLKRDPRGLT